MAFTGLVLAYATCFLTSGSAPTSAVDRNAAGDPIASVDGRTVGWSITAIVGGAIGWPIVAAAITIPRIAVAVGRIAVAITRVACGTVAIARTRVAVSGAIAIGIGRIVSVSRACERSYRQAKCQPSQSPSPAAPVGMRRSWCNHGRSRQGAGECSE